MILSVQLIAWSSESSGVFIIFPVDQEKMEAEVFLHVVNTNGVMKWFYVFFCSVEHCHCSQPPRATSVVSVHCLLLYTNNTYLTLLTQSLSVLSLVSVSVQMWMWIINLLFVIDVRTSPVPIATCSNLIVWRLNSYQKKKTSFIVNDLLWFATNSELRVLLQRYPLFSHWSVLIFFTSVSYFFIYFLQFSYSWKQCSALC